MELYKKLLNNKEYQLLVKKIESIKFITNGKWDWEHGLGHYLRVMNYANNILEQIHASKRIIELAQVISLLHDIGLSKSGINKQNHAVISSKIFQDFLVDIDLSLEELSLMEHAILYHSNGDDMKSLLDFSLTLADKLDVTYHRVIDSSIHDYINNEFKKIRNVDILINRKKLIVNYTVLDNFDINVLSEWKKCITIPCKCANFLGKDFNFSINDNQISDKVLEQVLKKG